MQSVGETLITEYLEQHGFLVRPLRKSRLQSRRAPEEGLDLYVRRIDFTPGARAPNFFLFSSELRYVESAIICVRGWFGDKAALGSMTSGQDIQHYIEANVIKNVEKWFEVDSQVTFGTKAPPLKVLVAPVFPAQEPYRSQCIELLDVRGVDGILSFKSMILDLIDQIDTKQIYEKSELLQLLRALKTFDLIKDSQMNLHVS